MVFKCKESRKKYRPKPNVRAMCSAFLSELADMPGVESEEEATKVIQRIIQREEVHGG